MSRIINQNIWMKLTIREQNYLKQIADRKKKLDEISKQSGEIHDDIKNAQLLLTIHYRERYEAEGFVAGAEVIYTPKGTKHKIVSPGIYFDADSNCMKANLNPNTKGPFSCAFVDELKISKSKKKK